MKRIITVTLCDKAQSTSCMNSLPERQYRYLIFWAMYCIELYIIRHLCLIWTLLRNYILSKTNTKTENKFQKTVFENVKVHKYSSIRSCKKIVNTITFGVMVLFCGYKGNNKSYVNVYWGTQLAGSYLNWV